MACNGPTELIFPKNMDHNSIDFQNDLIVPIKNFFEKYQINCKSHTK